MNRANQLLAESRRILARRESFPDEEFGFPEETTSRGGSATLLGSLCQVIQSLGTTPPYSYMVQTVTRNGPGDYTTVDDAFALYNAAEEGPNGTGVRKLPVGSIVDYAIDGNGNAYTNTSNYRGTFA